MTARQVGEEIFKTERNGWSIEIRREIFEETPKPSNIGASLEDSPLAAMGPLVNTLARQYEVPPEITDSFDITLTHREHGTQRLTVTGSLIDSLAGAIMAMRTAEPRQLAGLGAISPLGGLRRY